MDFIFKKSGREKQSAAGFTLIELLIVIAVMAILTSVVFVALNPLGRFQDARNNRRWTDVNAILQAIKLHQVDNGGLYHDALSEDNIVLDSYYMIGGGASCSLPCTGAGSTALTLDSACVPLADLADLGYLPSIPFDPNAEGAGADHSYYYILRSSNGTITVGSCSEEAGSSASTPVIEVSR